MSSIEIFLLAVTIASLIGIVALLATCASGVLAPSRIAARAQIRAKRHGLTSPTLKRTRDDIYDYETHGL